MPVSPVIRCGLPLALLLLAGCGRPRESERYVRPDKVKDFDRLYAQNCSACHGPDGKRGPAPPLNDPLFLAIVPDAELEMVIAEGREGTLMPAFLKEAGGTLTEEQVGILAKGVRQRWQKDPGRPKDKLPSYVVSAAGEKGQGRGSLENGARVFQAACASCHGDDGKGGNSGTVNDPNFLALLSDQVLRRLVITGRPDFGMPDYAGTDRRDVGVAPLSERDIADVVALLVSWRRGEGKAE